MKNETKQDGSTIGFYTLYDVAIYFSPERERDNVCSSLNYYDTEDLINSFISGKCISYRDEDGVFIVIVAHRVIEEIHVDARFYAERDRRGVIDKGLSVYDAVMKKFITKKVKISEQE